MVYPSILLAFCSLLITTSFADKPIHICSSTNSEPTIQLGGYNVPLSAFGGMGQQNGIQMVDTLWRKTLLDQFEVTIQPARNFNPITLEGLGPDRDFAFHKRRGQFRGVGVRGGDTEISGNEGIYIHFGGMVVKELAFGVRALFVERPNRNFYGSGLVTLYRDGKVVNDELPISFSTDGNDDDDGQETFSFISDEPFDAVSFITMSHSLYDTSLESFYDNAISPMARQQRGNHYGPSSAGHHDYFLEYLEICHDAPMIRGD